jgi:hypothetical protein
MALPIVYVPLSGGKVEPGVHVKVNPLAGNTVEFHRHVAVFEAGAVVEAQLVVVVLAL